jgi:hypothetical protein
MNGSRNSYAIACCLSALALAGCSRPAQSDSVASFDAGAAASSVAAASPPHENAIAANVADVDAPDSAVDRPLELRAAYATAAPVGGKSVGHTSVVFKLKLEGGLDAAYKPRSTRGNRRYRGEVAAYRLARSLSLENVPYATIRSFDYEALERAVGREPIFAQVVPEGARAESETGHATDAGSAAGASEVRGALMPWIKGLDFLPLEKEGEVAKWRAWLKADGVIPDDQKAMAAQISTMIAFDYVTGNWDRWSGGNVGFDHAKNEILFIDNDGAFFDPVPVKEMRRGVDFFDGTQRFSRGFVAALRAVDLAKAFGEEVPGEPLLSAHQVAQADARRKKALAAIDAKIATLGENAVLAFE